MTQKLVDEYEYINQRLKEIEAEKERLRNTPATETPKEADNHEWSFSIDNIYGQ